MLLVVGLLYIGYVIAQIMVFKSSTLTNIQFETIISNPWLTVLGQGIFILITMVIVMLGVEKRFRKSF